MLAEKLDFCCHDDMKISKPYTNKSWNSMHSHSHLALFNKFFFFLKYFVPIKAERHIPDI